MMMVCDLCKASGRSGKIDTILIECRTEDADEPWSGLDMQLQLCEGCQDVFAGKLTDFVRSLGGGKTFDDLKGPAE